MQQLRAGAKPPKWRGANFVGGVRRAVLLDTISRADVVQQEISKGMELLAAERGRDGVESAVDGGAGGSGDERADVTTGAADGFKDGLALIHVSGDGAAGRNFGGAHESGERTEVVIDV